MADQERWTKRPLAFISKNDLPSLGWGWSDEDAPDDANIIWKAMLQKDSRAKEKERSSRDRRRDAFGRHDRYVIRGNSCLGIDSADTDIDHHIQTFHQLLRLRMRIVTLG